MSDSAQIAMWGTLGTLALTFQQYVTWRIGNRAAAAVARVKTDLSASNEAQNLKLDSIQSTGELVHKLVNSASLIQARLLAVATRRIADAPGATADDVHAAHEAARLLRDHETRQAEADTAAAGAATGAATVKANVAKATERM